MLKLSIKTLIHRVKSVHVIFKNPPVKFLWYLSLTLNKFHMFLKDYIANFDHEFTSSVYKITIFMISHFMKGTQLYLDNFQTYWTYKEKMIN